VFFAYSTSYTTSTVFAVPSTIKAAVVHFSFIQDNGNYITLSMYFNASGVYIAAGNLVGNLALAASGTGGWTMTNMTNNNASRGVMYYMGSSNG